MENLQEDLIRDPKQDHTLFNLFPYAHRHELVIVDGEKTDVAHLR